MEKQKIGKLHKIIKKMKHSIDEEDVLGKYKFLEHNEKYIKILNKIADVLIFIFSPLFIIFFAIFFLPLPTKIEELIAKYSITLPLFFGSLFLFFVYLIIKIELAKFKRYVKTKNEDKDIDY
jgi:hypothetical protein